ncbi:hypothetical protein HK101_004773 [Irineochytrium annulatum]|nr:hypothetical protein HK101_004773 [Irineochytrium annulatum]
MPTYHSRPPPSPAATSPGANGPWPLTKEKLSAPSINYTGSPVVVATGGAINGASSLKNRVRSPSEPATPGAIHAPPRGASHAIGAPGGVHLVVSPPPSAMGLSMLSAGTPTSLPAGGHRHSDIGLSPAAASPYSAASYSTYQNVAMLPVDNGGAGGVIELKQRSSFETVDPRAVESFAMCSGGINRMLRAGGKPAWSAVDMLIMLISEPQDLRYDPGGGGSSSKKQEQSPANTRRSMWRMSFYPGGGNKPQSGHNSSGSGPSASEPYSEDLHRLRHSVKYFIAAVNLQELYRSYESSRRLGSSFTKHVTIFVQNLIAESSLPVSGVLMLGLGDAVRASSSKGNFVYKLVSALRAEPEFRTGSSARRAIYLDEFGAFVWDQIRDDVNGLFFKNIILAEPGGLKPRLERNEFDEMMNKLKIEITLRSDFMIFGAESVTQGPDHIDAACIRYSTSWYQWMGFKLWFCHGGADFTRRLDDIRPLRFPKLSADGIFEVAVSDTVQRLKGDVDRTFYILRAENIPARVAVGPDLWRALLASSPLPDGAAVFFSAVMPYLATATANLFDDALYDRVPPVQPRRRRDVAQLDYAAPHVVADVHNRELLHILPTQLVRTVLALAGPRAKRNSEAPSYMQYVTLAAVVAQFGTMHTSENRDRLRAFLGRTLFDLQKKKLIASFKANVDVDGGAGSLSPGFTAAVELLREVIQRPSAAARWLLRLSPQQRQREIISLMEDLVNGLEDGNVKVWLATKASLIYQDEKSRETIWSYAEIRDDCLHVFVSNDHPNPIEVVMHAFAKVVFKWPTSLCILVESLAVAQARSDTDERAPVPCRFAVQVEAGSHSARLRYIRNASTARAVLRDSHNLTPGEGGFLATICDHVAELSEHILVDRQVYEDLRLGWATNAYAPVNPLESALAEECGRCTLTTEGSARLLSAFRAVASILDRGASRADKAAQYGACLLFMALQKALRRVAYMELEVALQVKNALFLPDADQVAVGLEMTTTQSNIRTIFELTSLQLAAPIHRRLRNKAFSDVGPAPPGPEEGVIAAEAAAVATEDDQELIKEKGDGHVMEKKIANAYLFIYPILVDLILVRAFGSGIFYSNRMSLDTQYTVSIIFLFMFPIVGSVMNSIGRTVTYYFYQKSIPLMVEAFVRRDWVAAVLAFIYSMSFSLYMTMLCGLVSFRDPDEFFLKSAGPRVVFVTIPMLATSAILSRFAFTDTSHSNYVLGIYTFMLLVTVVYMCHSYTKIAAMYLSWPDRIEITPKPEIIELYLKEGGVKPAQDDGEDTELFEKRKRRWERTAVEWWMLRLVRAKQSKLPAKEPGPVKRRLTQFKWEDMLMKWYFERSGATPPKRYSNEWDIALKQAIGEIKKKFNVEKLNRGDILFDFESPAIIFGFMYFMVIFIDKWSLWIATGSAALFLPNATLGEEYTTGVLFGTLYLLFSSGLLELTLSNMYVKQKAIVQESLAEAKGVDRMVADHWSHLRKIYKSELASFALYTMSVLLVTMCVMLAFNRDRTTLFIFGATAFGYLGLLTGLFHKMFITSDEQHLNFWMFLSILTSLAASVIAVKLTGNTLWVAGTITLNGWLFGLTCVATYSRETLATVHYRITISPTLTSSGQRMLGFAYNASVKKRLDSLVSRLVITQSRFKPIVPTSALGSRIANRLQSSIQRVAALPKTHLLSLAFPEALELSDKIISKFFDGSLVVHIIPAKLEVNGVRYQAVSTTHKGVLQMFFDGPEPDGEWTHEDIAVLCEAMIHEVVEESGLSHSDACISEALLAITKESSLESFSLQGWIPYRMLRQLLGSTAPDFNDIQLKTEEVIGNKAALTVDIDRLWGNATTGFSHQDRLIMITLAKNWNDLLEESWNSSHLASHWNFEHGKTILGSRPGTDRVTVRTALARCIVSAILAKNLEEYCSSNYPDRSGRTAQTIKRKNRVSSLIGTITRKRKNKDTAEETNVEDLFSGTLRRRAKLYGTDVKTFEVESSFVSNLVGYFVDGFVSSFLAITADGRFGRELAVAPVIVRPALSLLYFVARRLISGLNTVMVFNRETNIKQLMKRNEQGLFKVARFAKGPSGPLRVKRVDSFNSATLTVVSLVDTHDATYHDTAIPEATSDLALVRYTGPKSDDWVPGSKDKALSRGYYSQVAASQWGPNPFRLIFEHFFDNSGSKVVKKQTYEYEDAVTIFPTSRKVYLVEYPGGSEAPKELLSEIHVFSTLAWYSVASASLKKLHKPTKKYIHVVAEYPDSGVEGPQRIFYKCKFPQEWTLVLKSTASISPDATPNYAFAEFSKQGEDGFYRTIFDYSHPQHPTMTSVFIRRKSSEKRMDLASHNEMDLGTAMMSDPGEPVATPIEIRDDHFGLLALNPPPDFQLSAELADAGFKMKRRTKWSIVPPFVRSVEVEYRSGACSTLRKREDLWASWRAGKVAGVFAREIDERFLRDEPVLKNYWRYRDRGDTLGARAVLAEQKQALDVCLKVPDRPATRTHLKIRYSDLYMLGVGGDAHQIFSFDEEVVDNKTLGSFFTLRKPQPAVAQGKVSDGKRLNVMNVDSGTWPTGGGGVGSCRRDLIDGLSRVRWNAIAEIGSAEAVQKDYQIEKNIDSITYVVLWDVDFGTPNENVYRTENQLQLRRKQRATTDKVVSTFFVPLIEKLIEGCFCEEISDSLIAEYENVFVGLYQYFQSYDWTSSWNHVLAQEAWIQGWLKGASELWKAGKLHNFETPTLQQVDILYGLITRLLLPLTVKLAKIPVVHASHHGIQAILGVIAQKVHGSSFVIWDHGILWRERLFGLCGDGMPRFTQIGFIGISRLVARVVYARATFVTPCTSIQNVDWEAWIGGGKHGSAKDNAEMHLKVNPVLNGMDLSKFSVKRNLEAPGPTAVMLSHISPVKDIMNAIMAASHIVNEFKLTSYKLNIYGSPEKEPPYTTECQAAIANLGVASNVTLMGLGSPSNVLPTGWIFVNSSITEGLPLALGEAGLCGLPVACTDVGGSREVVSDLAKGEVYGAIVPPSKPRQLALAQLKVLAMADGLIRVAEPTSDVPDVNLEELIAKGPVALEARIKDPQVNDLRRKLGLKLKERTVAVFSIARYLREHEQILWAANYRSNV